MPKVIPAHNNELYVEWVDVAGTTFTLYRSGSPADDFKVIASNVNVPYFIDNNVNLYDEGNKYYYKVVGLTGGTTTTSEVFSLRYNRPDNIAHKLIHEANITLRVMRNPPVHVLIKKRFGDPCPDCTNPVTKRPKYADCQTCFGTGFLAGYFPAIPILLSRDMSQLVNSSSIEDAGKVSLTPIDAWTINRPLLTPEDVIVDVMDKRFSIQSVIPRTKSQYVFRQIIQMAPLEMGHPAYQIRVPREG